MVDNPNQPPREPQDFPDFSGEQPQTRRTEGTPAVASAPGKTLVLVIAAISVVGLIMWSILDKDEAEQVADAKPEQVQVPIADTPILPPAPPEELPPLPPPPPPSPPDISAAPGEAISPTFQAPNAEEMLARLKSDSVIFQSKDNMFGLGNSGGNQADADLNDPNSAFLASVRNSEAETAEATHLGNLDRLIAQGKMIDAVLETAINTDLPGTLRAIVSHDVFAEHGSHILIPKGSRLIGTYNTGILRGQSRVFVVWTRLIRPDGVDIKIMSEGTDPLGRAGLSGQVDSKYFEIFGNAVLISAVTLSVAAGVQAAVGDEDSRTTRRVYSDGSIDTEGSPVGLAAQDFAYTLGGTTRELIGDLMDIRPTITIDQGTLLKVFVNRDLIFPQSTAGQPLMIP